MMDVGKEADRLRCVAKISKKIDTILAEAANCNISGRVLIEVCFEKGGVVWTKKHIEQKI